MASRHDKLFQRRKAKQKKDLARRAAQIEQRRRALIVCEGEKTEVYYLNALVASLKLTTADVEVCGKCDSAPIKVVKFGIQKFDCDKDYDVIFFVFDRDSHTTYSSALQKIRRLNKNEKFQNVNLIPVTSIPCFEIWFLMHFEPHSKPYNKTGRKSPCENLIGDLKRKPGFTDYKKGCDGYFQKLYELLPQAKSNSRIVLKNSQASGAPMYCGNPSTLMHQLVGELEKIAEEYKR